MTLNNNSKIVLIIEIWLYCSVTITEIVIEITLQHNVLEITVLCSVNKIIVKTTL